MTDKITRIGNLRIGELFLYNREKFRVSGFKDSRTVVGMNVCLGANCTKDVTVDILKVRKTS